MTSALRITEARRVPPDERIAYSEAKLVPYEKIAQHEREGWTRSPTDEERPNHHQSYGVIMVRRKVRA